ncbi:MAG: nitroreductase family protein [Methanothrix sp.]|nr:nitroreductase family protein [Methanothrix sp.]
MKTLQRIGLILLLAAPGSTSLGQAVTPQGIASGTTAAVAAPGSDAIFDLFKSRRSVRAYLPTPVPEEHILKILDAARTAPTSGNQQPWKFLVIRDRAKLDRLVEEMAQSRASRGGKLSGQELTATLERVRANMRTYLSAPVFIIILTDSQSRYPDYNHWDGPLAAGYLMLAARALWYGTVFATDSFDNAVLRKVFSIPDQYEFVCATPLGVPAAWPQSPSKKPLESFVVFESFGK